MRSIGFALFAAPWLAWGMVRVLGRASPRVRRWFLGAGALALAAEVAFFAAGLRLLDRQLETIAFAFGGALVAFPFAFVVAIRKRDGRSALLVPFALIAVLASACGAFLWSGLWIRDGGDYVLGERYRAVLEIRRGRDAAGWYEVTVQRRLDACPWIGREFGFARTRVDPKADVDPHVVLDTIAVRPAAVLLVDDRARLRIELD